MQPTVDSERCDDRRRGVAVGSAPPYNITLTEQSAEGCLDAGGDDQVAT